MKVLMLGWEFPPFQSGGLGTACRDLCKGLSRKGVQITFAMPYAPEGASAGRVRVIGANSLAKIRIRRIPSLLRAYQTPEHYMTEKIISEKAPTGRPDKTVYGKNIFEEVCRLADAAKILAEEPHDVIHAHDWMTYPAGIAARRVSGRPLVAHIHATEDDRTGGNPNYEIKEIERRGLQSADLIIANSQWTKKNVLSIYDLNPDKVAVVHWGIDHELAEYEKSFTSPWQSSDRLVVFLGRLFVQKGPGYFIEAAARVLQHYQNVKFVMAGGGDLLGSCIQSVAERALQDKIMFTGALPWGDAQRLLQAADLFVMPSVSEPFGLVALEALKNGAPIIVSNQSGVSEVVSHCLKTDFWDVEDLAAKILSVLQYAPLHHELKQNGGIEVLRFNLDDPAAKVVDAYRRAINILSRTTMSSGELAK